MTTSDDHELEARVRARVGSTLRGKYQLDGVLGIGGMAAVYSATHRNGRKVAVKLLHPELSFSGEAKSRFLREGLVANTVKHPGVVTILDDDTNEDGAAFLVMELLEGRTLDELWEQNGRRLPLPAVVTAGVMLLDILSAAHAAGVVHRDIKPANLFLTSAWELKILDFGISRLRDARSATATQTGMMMGSPAFMASEQALGRSEEIDGRTDLWSAAASLFTLACGAFVHEGQTAQEMLIRAATTPVRSFAAAMPEAPALVVAVLDRALAFAKHERWGTASEMAVALSEAARASFGEEPSTNAFVPLVPYMPGAAKGKSVPPPRASLHSAGALLPLGTPGLAPMRPVGPGFTQLTSSISGPIGAPGSRRRKRTLMLSGVAGFAVLMGVAVLIGRASRGPEVGTTGRASELTTAEGPANASAEGERAEHAADIARPIAEPSASASTASPAIDVSALPEASRPAPPPRSTYAPRATGKASGKPSSFFPPPRSTVPPPSADPCNPPYRFDFFGNKVAKPGCSL